MLRYDICETGKSIRFAKSMMIVSVSLLTYSVENNVREFDGTQTDLVSDFFNFEVLIPALYPAHIY